MAGIPPLIGFFAKQFVLYSSLESGYNFISIVAILVSVISASYYLKIVKVLYNESKSSTLQKTIKGVASENSSLFSEEALRFAQLSNLYTILISFVVILNKNLNNFEQKDLNNNIKLINSNKELAGNSLTFNNLIISNTHSFLISTLTLTILLFILKPSLILNSTQLLSLSLFNF
jgi:NADH-ubiquinone oxidoreductase chain 2